MRPLYVVLLDEYERWTGDVELVRHLEYEARAAVRWIDEYADLQGNGYVSYRRRRETGLENQCWKDSWDSISYHDGRLPGFPRATCELQGYAYDAKVRAARLAREVWLDAEYADRLEAEAADLKERFNRDFWVEDGDYFAIALDADGSRTRHPVQYPTACSPQAWSTGTPLLLLRTMLGLEPIGDRLLVDPALPKTIGRLELLDIPGRWGRTDAFGRGRYGT